MGAIGWIALVVVVAIALGYAALIVGMITRAP